jgi:hypothetical protein
MNKKSKVIKVTGNGTWSPKNDPSKVFYAYEIEMENGDTGIYNSIKDNQNKFVEGEMTNYEFTGGEYPKIKPHYEKKSTNLANDNLMIKCVSLKSSARIFAGINVDDNKIIELARKFENYLNE